MGQWTPTTCMRCAVGCGLLQRADPNHDRVSAAQGDIDHPTNRGLACQRGINETTSHDGTRLTSPRIRRNGTLVTTNWGTAIEAISSRIEDALAETRNGVAVLGSGQQTNEAAYALGKVARGRFGTRYYDANTTLCMASAVTAYYSTFGSDAPPPTYEDIPDAQTHVIWGANPAVAHPVLYRWIADSVADAGELIVVDPIATDTAANADIHVRPEPGTDLALARAVLTRIVADDETDRAFITEATVGFEQLVDSLPTVEDAAETAGVSVELVDRIADAFTDPTLLYWGMGVNQSVQGTATARALIDLCLATGNLGPGTGPFSLTGQANSMGTRICSSKGTWPGQRAFTDPDHRKTVAETWSVPVDRLPDDPGPGPVGIVDALAHGPPEVCWTVATNPVAGMPDSNHVRDVLDDTFLVVQDAFLTETTKLADVVLPAATWGESAGTVVNMERRVSRIRAAGTPPSGVKDDVDIIAAIAVAVSGASQSFIETPQATYDELRELTAGTPADLSGIPYDRLDADLAVRWPASSPSEEGGYRYVDADGWEFPTPSGRARFSTEHHRGIAEPTDSEYPLTLTTGRRSDAYNTGVRGRDDDTAHRPTGRIHPETMAQHGEAFDGETTVVSSRRGSVTVDLCCDRAVPEGMVWLPIHHPAVNALTLPTVDPESDQPNLKQCAVTLTAPSRTQTVL